MTRCRYYVSIYTDVFTRQAVELGGDDSVTLPAWGYRVLSK